MNNTTAMEDIYEKRKALLDKLGDDNIKAIEFYPDGSVKRIEYYDKVQTPPVKVIPIEPTTETGKHPEPWTRTIWVGTDTTNITWQVM